MCTRFSVRYLMVMIAIGLVGFGLPTAVSSAPEEKPSAKASPPKTRTFAFSYSATLTGLEPGKTARIWIPVPPSNEDQEVKIESKDLPGTEQISTEPKYGNQVLYVEGKADNQGMISLIVTYRVQRREVRGDLRRSDSTRQATRSRFGPDETRSPGCRVR